MQLTEREKAAVEHLTGLAVGFLTVAESYDLRMADRSGNRSELALAHRMKAAGLIIAIAFIRGITPGEVEQEIEAVHDGASSRI